MIETPEQRLFARRQGHAGHWVRQIRKPHGHWPVEVRGTIRLDRDHERKLKPGRQRLRQAIGRHGRDADATAAGTVVGKERVGGHGDRHALERLR